MSPRSRSVSRMTVPQNVHRHTYQRGDLAMSDKTKGIIEASSFNSGGFNPNSTIIFPVGHNDYKHFSINSVITLKNITTHQWYNVRVLLKYDDDEFKKFKVIHPMDDVRVSQCPIGFFNHALMIYIIDKFRCD